VFHFALVIKFQFLGISVLYYPFAFVLIAYVGGTAEQVGRRNILISRSDRPLELVWPGYFWLACHPSRVDAKRGDHFLQPDFWTVSWDCAEVSRLLNENTHTLAAEVERWREISVSTDVNATGVLPALQF